MTRRTRVLGARTVTEYTKALRVWVVRDGTTEPAVYKVAPGVDMLAESTRSRLVAALNWSARKGDRAQEAADALIAQIPFAASTARRTSHHLSASDLAKVEAALPNAPQPLRTLMKVLLGLGLRAEELLSLARENVEAALDTGLLRFKRKRGHLAELAVTNRLLLLTELTHLGDWSVVGELISSGHSESRKAKLRRELSRWGGSIGVQLHPHLFRHAFAQKLYDHCKDLVVVQTWLGHESIETTRIYLEGRTSDADLFDM